MTTLEELEAEAAKLYPTGPMDHLMIDATGNPMPTINDWRQKTHVRAKTITAEQRSVAKAAGNLEYQKLYALSHDPAVARLVSDAIDTAFRAAGFYVEES